MYLMFAYFSKLKLCDYYLTYLYTRLEYIWQRTAADIGLLIMIGSQLPIFWHWGSDASDLMINVFEKNICSH